MPSLIFLDIRYLIFWKYSCKKNFCYNTINLSDTSASSKANLVVKQVIVEN